MMIPEWEELPPNMQTEEVRSYYEILRKKRFQLSVKRCFDILASLLGLVLTFPLAFILVVWILIDSRGCVFFRQERVTAYGKAFKIHKFRTMTDKNARPGEGYYSSQRNENRVTRAGRFLRKYHLDELPQLIDILLGDMTFVGTRPEVPEYVAYYTPEMTATLLLPAGLTSEASIRFQNEGDALSATDDANTFYRQYILPEKMAINLRQLSGFSLWNDWICLVHTVSSLRKRGKIDVGIENT